jgi:hypothetical protein
MQIPGFAPWQEVRSAEPALLFLQQLTEALACQSAANWVRFYKARIEHNESAIPPKLSVKADIADRQGWATS